MLSAALILYAVLFARSGHRNSLSAQSKGDLLLSFKKFFPFSSFVVLAPLDVLLPRLVNARFKVDPLYVPRALVTTGISAINTVVSLPERLLVPWLVRHKKVPDPIAIVGLHRSGTTHLHNLLALDPQFIAPRSYQVINPTGFLLSSWLFVPLMWWFVPWKRPMDPMAFSLFAPQEEEPAITCSSRLSPYWGMILPQDTRYERYLFSDRFEPAERAAWKAKLLLFLRKLCLFSNARPLLKNPCNTGRIDMLLELFPRAKFVHIHRNPYHVYLSYLYAAREGMSRYQLQEAHISRQDEDRLLDFYVAIEECFYRNAAQLPADQVVDIRYEQLDRDPIAQIEHIYRQLGMTITATYRARIEDYLRSIAHYQKSTFTAIPEDRDREVHAKLAPLCKQWGYEMP